MERIKKLKKLKTKTLIDVVKNYKKYNYPIELKDEALRILETRGIRKDTLKLSGNLSNYFYDEAMKEYKRYNFNSQAGLVLFILSLFIYFQFSVILSLFVYFTALFFVGLSFSNSRKISKLLKIDKKYNPMFSVFIVLLCFVIYFVIFFYMRNQVREKIFFHT